MVWALRERIGGISPKVLTETLRRLQVNGLVEHRAYAGSPPRVEYTLTGLGRTLLEPIEAFGAWAFEHSEDVMAAREQAESAGLLTAGYRYAESTPADTVPPER